MCVRWVREQRLSVMPVSSPRPSTRGCESMGRYLGALVPSFSIRARNSSTVQHRMSRVPCVVCVCGRVRLVRACVRAVICVALPSTFFFSVRLGFLFLFLLSRCAGITGSGALAFAFFFAGVFFSSPPDPPSPPPRYGFSISSPAANAAPAPSISRTHRTHRAHRTHTHKKERERESALNVFAQLLLVVVVEVAVAFQIVFAVDLLCRLTRSLQVLCACVRCGRKE